MNPEFALSLAEQHRADLQRSAARARRGSRRQAAQRRLGWPAPPPAAAGPGQAARPARPARPAPLVTGTEAHGFRLYLTPAESRRLERDCARLVRKFADRAARPEDRPAGAVAVEVVVLSRAQLEPAGS